MEKYNGFGHWVWNAINGIPKSFQLFGRAFKNAKKDFWISIQVLFWISIVLSFIFFYVEHLAQPDEYPDYWSAFVWTFTRYIGDPGHFGGKGPVTLWGRHIDTIIGILKILIFAVPAGLFANGFRKAMEDDKRANHLQECREKIQKSFRRSLVKGFNYRVAPRRVSIVSLQAKKNMKEGDIVDTVAKFDEFRLRNLANTQTAEERPQDRLVIELLPLNEKTVDGYVIDRRSYGIRIDRQSSVTIVAPTAATENSIDHIAYYLAQFGGFNYISREFVTDVDEPGSYYTINGNADEREKPLTEYIGDIKSMSKGKENWNVFLIAADNVHDTQFHFVHKTNNKVDFPTTVLDENGFLSFYEAASNLLKENHQLQSDLDEKYAAVGTRNIGVTAGGGKENNCFTLRISYSVITWMERWVPVIVDLAKVFKQHLESPDRQAFVENMAWKTKGWGMGEGEIRMPVESGTK